MIKLQAHKTCIFGIQESGKTYWAKKMYREFKHPIVFCVNTDDGWDKLPQLYVYQAQRDKVLEEFKVFIKKAREWVMQDKIDLIIIDEADLFFRSNYDLEGELLDIVLNHRHLGKKGVAIWFMTRRPQDIPTKIVESSKYLVIFKLEGANAIDRFGEIHKDLPKMIAGLDYNRHNFVLKELGKPPIMHAPL